MGQFKGRRLRPAPFLFCRRLAAQDIICRSGTRRVLMLHLFVPPSSFDGCGQDPYDGASPSQLLAELMLIVSFGALTLTLCYALAMFLVSEPLEIGFGPPASRLITLSM